MDVSAQKTDQNLISPATNAAALIPNDDQAILRITRSIYVGQTGDVAVEMADGMTVTFAAVPAGTVLPVRIHKLLQTGTTASGLVGLW